MNVLIYLVPIALTLGLAGLAAFLWSLRAGQYDDMEGAALRVLSDDDLTDLGRNATDLPPLRIIAPKPFSCGEGEGTQQ